MQGEEGDESDVVAGQKTFEMPYELETLSGLLLNPEFIFPEICKVPLTNFSFFGSYLADVTETDSRAIFVCICIPTHL